MKKLILTVGLPRSGKTTWARQQGHPIVNPDSIRLALHGQRFYAPAELLVWATARLMVDALFRAGHETVIVDATHVAEKRRAQWKEWFPNHEVELHVVPTDPTTCLARAQQENDAEIAPVILRMADEWDLAVDWKPAGWRGAPWAG